MPIFEFECRACGAVTSFLEKSGAQQSHNCEKCGSKETQKIFSVFNAKAGSPKASGPARCPRPCGDGACPHAG
jgi:putative FmdB family regulatory protein